MEGFFEGSFDRIAVGYNDGSVVGFLDGGIDGLDWKATELVKTGQVRLYFPSLIADLELGH